MNRHTMSIDIVYVANLKPGDLAAGDVDRHAPTRPAQPYAVAMEVRRVEKEDGGYRMYFSDDPMTLLYSSLRSASDQVMVIRP